MRSQEGQSESPELCLVLIQWLAVLKYRNIWSRYLSAWIASGSESWFPRGIQKTIYFTSMPWGMISYTSPSFMIEDFPILFKDHQWWRPHSFQSINPSAFCCGAIQIKTLYACVFMSMLQAYLLIMSSYEQGDYAHPTVSGESVNFQFTNWRSCSVFLQMLCFLGPCLFLPWSSWLIFSYHTTVSLKPEVSSFITHYYTWKRIEILRGFWVFCYPKWRFLVSSYNCFGSYVTPRSSFYLL